MKWLLIGIEVSLGWSIGGTIGHMLDEIVRNRRYDWKWYRQLNGKQEKPNKPTAECKIGFVVNKE